jgi:hypothetical protein
VWVFVCVGVLVICVHVFTMFFIVCTVFGIVSFIYTYLFLFVLSVLRVVIRSVRTIATE